jgi:hypothetical protein
MYVLVPWYVLIRTMVRIDTYHGTYVHVYRRAHLFLDTLRGSQGPAADSQTQGYFRGPSPQDVALRGVMQLWFVSKPTCSQTL